MKKNKKVIILLITMAGILFLIGGIFALNGFFGSGGNIPSDTMTRGLVGYWSFDEGAGATSTDLSGNGNDGILINNPMWTNGKISGALQFDGINDYLEITFSQSTTTIAMWVENSGTWEHVVNSEGITYVNGVSGSPTSWPIYISGTTIQVGKTDTDTFFIGKIDEVRVYNRTLSAEEVRYHYNKGGPVAHWKFDEGSASTTYDSTTNNNDGYLILGSLGNTTTSDSWIKGKYGTAINFDGVDDYVEATVSQGTTTVLFWMKETGSNWQHVVNSNETYYINGEQSATAPSSYPINFSGTTVYVGKTGASSYFNGIIDDVRIYNYERAGEQVREDYNNGKALYIGSSVYAGCDKNPAGCMDYGLVGYWSFDEGSGTSTYDGSESRVDGIFVTATSSPQWINGKKGGALNFDGADDFVEVPNSSAHELQEFTLEFWERNEALDTGHHVWIIGNYYWGHGYIIRYYGSKLDFSIGSGSYNNIFSEFFARSNTWRHTVITFKDGEQKIYFNGVLENSNNLSLVPSYNYHKPFYIAGSGNTGFNGAIDEVRIYNRVLSEEEVRYHYNKSEPVAHWKFDEGSASTTYDGTTNNNDGYLILGSLGNTTTSDSWIKGKYGSSINFDGTDDYVEATVSQGTTTVSFWMKEIGGNWQHVANSNGTYYINGEQSVSAPSIFPINFSGTTIEVGKTGASSYFNGIIDDVRIYNYTRTGEQVREDYNNGKSFYLR